MNQSGRMEKVREALANYERILRERHGKTLPLPGLAAALAEVEEWEQGMAQRMEVGRDMADRLETCWAERKAAEAEADRLKAALEQIEDAADGIPDSDVFVNIARAALAPADRNTT